jgi:hypothetical protein
MLKKILIGLGIVIAIVVVIIASRPDTYSVERSTTIAAPASVVYPLINNFHRWKEWSPWEGLDPAMTRTFEGPASGVGASYAWSGNDQVGKGRMTITDTHRNEDVHIKLEFIEPWEATNTTLFSLRPEHGRLNVTWRMEGSHNFVGKAFSMFMDMDSMVGKDFEKGLDTLKRVAQIEARKREDAAEDEAEPSNVAQPDAGRTPGPDGGAD